MGIEITDINNVDKFLDKLKDLESKTLKVGVLASAGSDMLKIANANEYGATIVPKKGKFLSIPLQKKYKNLSPRNVEGLFYFEDKDGDKFLAKKKGKKGIEMCYILKTKVEIPERAFIRGTFDEKIALIEEFVGKAFKRYADSLSNDDLIALIGEFCKGQVQKYMVDLSSPANSILTTNLKGSTNPLIDTGHLKDSISYEVE